MRFSYLDVLKHLYAIAVIFMHMSSSTRYSADVNGFIDSVRPWIDGAVLGFFMISGFFCKRNRLLSYKDFGKLIQSLARRLLLPFLLFSLLYAGGLFALNKYDLTRLPRDLIMLKGSSMQLYFLPLLFGVTLLFKILISITRRQNVTIIATTVIVLTAAIINPTETSTGGGDPKLYFLYFGIFCLGNLLRQSLDLNIFNIASVALAITTIATGFYDSRFFDIAIIVTLHGIAVSLSARNKAPAFFEKGSGATYLLHTPILNFTVSALLIHLGISDRANVIGSVLITYVSCLVIAKIVDLACPRFNVLLLE